MECEFLIPIRRDRNLSDGEVQSLESWEWLKEEICARFKGCPTAPGLYQGVYEDPDTQERVDDECAKFIVAVPKESLDSLRAFLSDVCVEFRQKCIYLSIAGQVEFIYHPANDHD